ncbi:MAG: cytochrome c family protein [Kiloniellales bacterium]|nr:cytochrome c family protein [Kiloniellales bacterium]
MTQARQHHGIRLAVTGASLALGLLLASSSGALARAPDPAKVVGATECAECHKQETETWKKTHHYKTFKALPRNKKGREIAKALGLRRIRAEGLCVSCHFSSKEQKGKTRPIAGISCESCHSPAKDWLKRHSEYSGKKKNTETPEEAKQRWIDAEAAGMIRPKMIYTLTKNCYSCHVVPEEKLVNKGGHPAGSPFELVRWSQGEVRHNTWHNSGKENRPLSQERLRLFYAVGVAVELESALRALSKATEKDRFAVTMAKRVQIARLRARRLARATKDPELVKLARAASAAKLNLAEVKSLVAVADLVAKAAQAFAETHDGSKLAAIDRFLPKSAEHKGKTRTPGS